MRHKIACAQYIIVLSHGFIKRTLQLENVSSLNSAVERIKTIKIIQGSFDKKKGNYYFGTRKDEKEKKASCKKDRMENRKGRDYKEKGSVSQKGKIRKRFLPRVSACEKEVHFRSECSENKGNSD